MTIGERIKNRRIELNYSQDELAKKVGYKSRSSINKIELSRDLPLNKIEKMAEALETTPEFLMGWSLDQESEDEKLLNKIKQLSPEARVELDNFIEYLLNKYRG